ncbi:hypothetical protein [[Ruminococcus] lactaris]|uniref:hypothetical protein n=1 Tax=[Ruminococcus] lactaris TaxID=46228 RepID=UPI00241EDDE8|nr:hypothetical protein [[Ruminococcus] lactaris]MBS6792364.1 hypothetical protein [[Ruminococcus] lactaris]
MEKRKIVRGIILAVLLVCAVFLIYACPCCYRWIYCIRAGQAKRKITSRLLEDYK